MINTTPTPISPGASPFEAIRHEDETGDYWQARELMSLLEYSQWQKFSPLIRKAQTSCEGSGQDVENHFTRADEMVTIGSGAQRKVKGYRLTRYACYLVAMEADSSKEIVAQAKTYFAVKTREAELTDVAQANYLQWRHQAILSYMAHGYSQEWAITRVDGIAVRNQLTGEWSVRGIKQRDYSALTDRLHMGMFGLSTADHKALKGIPVTYKGKRAIWKQELRDANTVMENTLITLGELTARELHQQHDSQGRSAIEVDLDIAGAIVADTRQHIEAATGSAVISPRNLITDPDGGLFGTIDTGEDADR